MITAVLFHPGVRFIQIIINIPDIWFPDKTVTGFAII